MCRILSNIVCVVIILIINFSVYGQESVQRKFSTIAFGGKALSVTSFTQDADGVLWIGTNNGLFFYDGYQMYHGCEDDKNSSLQVNSLNVVGDTIFVGTDGGLEIYNIRKAQFEEPRIKFPTDIRALLYQDGILWIGSLNGLYKYNVSIGSIENASRNFMSHTVYSLQDIDEDNMYVGTYNGLYRYNRNHKTFSIENIADAGGRANLFVNSLLLDKSRNCLWIGTEGNLYLMDLNAHKVRIIPEFGNNSIKSLTLDREKSLIVGTDNGLYVYDGINTEHYSHDSRIGGTISNNIVWGVFVDKQNNLWAGTDYNISMSQNNNVEIIPISAITGIGDGNRFFSIFKDNMGLLWLGGTNGIIQYNLSNHKSKWYRMDSKRYPLSHNRVRDIYQDSQSNLWIATDGSINRYNYSTGQFIRYNVVNSDKTRNANWAYNVFEDQNQNLWIGCFLGGVFVVDREKMLHTSGIYVAEKNLSFNKNNNFVNQLIPSNDGGAWVLLYKGGGLYQIDGRSYNYKRIEIEKTTGFTPSFILCDKKSRLWCASHDKVSIIGNRGAVLQTIKISNYSDCEVLAMEQVEDKMWLSTTEGVWTIDTNSYKVERLQIPNHSFTCIYYDVIERSVILGGADEIVKVPLNTINLRHKAKKIFITEILVNDTPYASKEGNVRYLNEIKLNYDQNHILINFSDLNYSSDDKSRYIYNIEGLNNDWLPIQSDNNKISCANMEPGEYVLHIKSLDLEGNPSDAECSLRIIIMPPWFRSTLAYIIYTLCFIGFILWVINFFRVKNRLRIERIEKEKTLEQVNLKTEFFTNISHELKTPLSMIIAPIGRLLPEVKDATVSKYLNIAYDNAIKMNTLIHKALDFKQIDGNEDDMLIISQLDIVAFCRNIVNTYKEAYRQKNIIFASTVETIYMNVDVVKMESVVNNLISNACKYSPDGATITVSVSMVNEKVVIKVADDGVGIPQNEIPFIFQRLYQSTRTTGHKEGTGIGLYLVKRYIEMHQGSISVSSSEGEGSVFTVAIPIDFGCESRKENECVISPTLVDSQKPTILIVDDNDAIRSMLCDTFGEYYNCIAAENGKVGLAVCGSVTPDLIIADIMMPVMNGMEMCKKIKHNTALTSIPIILLTAKDNDTTEAKSAELGVDCFMSKPFNISVLMSRAKQLIDAKAKLRSKVRMEEITTVAKIEAESSDEKLLAEAVKIIEEHISDSELNVNFLCDKLGLGSKQLYRKIKQHTGVTPVDFIKQVRMKKAAMLIQQHKFSISEIMYMVGFSSSSYFAKCFQAHFGKAPRQYQEEMSKKISETA